MGTNMEMELKVEKSVKESYTLTLGYTRLLLEVNRNTLMIDLTLVNITDNTSTSVRMKLQEIESVLFNLLDFIQEKKNVP
jgi:hypothetical protein